MNLSCLHDNREIEFVLIKRITIAVSTRTTFFINTFCFFILIRLVIFVECFYKIIKKHTLEKTYIETSPKYR